MPGLNAAISQLATLSGYGEPSAEEVAAGYVAMEILEPLKQWINHEEYCASIVIMTEAIAGKSTTCGLMKIAAENGLGDLQGMITAIRGKVN